MRYNLTHRNYEGDTWNAICDDAIMQCSFQRSPSPKPLSSPWTQPLQVSAAISVYYRSLDVAVAWTDLRKSRVDPSKLFRIATRQVVHGGLGDVEARCSMVDCKNIDGLAIEGEWPAGAAL